MEDYKGYNLFNELENKALQAWNRMHVVLNITAASGKGEAANYLRCIDDEGKVALKHTLRMVDEHGYSKMRKTINA